LSATKKNPEETTGGTVEELLQVAERLFALEGVENVALTQIVAEAGQRNRSALHYHFGSRDGVLTAVINRRLAPLNARREALIDTLPPQPTPAQILKADLSPLGQAALDEPWGADYLSIIAQVTFHPHLLGRSMLDGEHLSGLRRCRRLLAAAAPEVPHHILSQRVAWLTDSVVLALARWVRDTPGEARNQAALDALLDQLTAYGTAGLLAPVPIP
jgi:AcrR family transcriptional regulator